MWDTPERVVFTELWFATDEYLSTPSNSLCFFFVLCFFGQNESYREEFLNERKEKERVLSLKDKLKRDLENAQSRISSLQEQVGITIIYNVKRMAKRESCTFLNCRLEKGRINFKLGNLALD